MTEKIDNGSSAGYDGPDNSCASVDGMTLLDWFAGQALPGLIIYESKEVTLDYSMVISTLAYSLAEAMIAEKRRREGECQK